ncbi:hypothetical protein QJQ45_014047 [Haematococcus lacustris]|nr:hypothetical protein QJQ45_014047 [Haematococcus lacustris]
MYPIFREPRSGRLPTTAEHPSRNNHIATQRSVTTCADDEGVKSKVKKGSSDGAWVSKQKYGITDSMRKDHGHWIKPILGSPDRVSCRFCLHPQSIQARKATVDTHAASVKHSNAVKAAGLSPGGRPFGTLPLSPAALPLSPAGTARVDKIAMRHAKQQLSAVEAAGCRVMTLEDSYAQAAADPETLQRFVTLVYLLMHGRPLVEYEQSRELLQALHVPGIGSHWSRRSAVGMLAGINQALEDELVHTVKTSEFISLSMDESTGVDGKGYMCIFMHSMDRDFVRQATFVDLPPVDGATADDLLDLLLATVGSKLQLSMEQLGSKLVSFGCDGASVLQGAHTGVVVQLRTKVAPFVQGVWCHAHRGQLAGKAIEDTPVISKLNSLSSTLAHYFCRSPKRQGELRAISRNLLGTDVKVLRRVPTRWVSLLSPLRRILRLYSALVQLFAESEEPQASAMYDSLMDIEVLLGLHLLLPMLQSLNSFIKLCQQRDVGVLELSHAVQQLSASVTRMYINESSRYNSSDFPAIPEALQRTQPAKPPPYELVPDVAEPTAQEVHNLNMAVLQNMSSHERESALQTVTRRLSTHHITFLRSRAASHHQQDANSSATAWQQQSQQGCSVAAAGQQQQGSNSRPIASPRRQQSDSPLVMTYIWEEQENLSLLCGTVRLVLRCLAHAMLCYKAKLQALTECYAQPKALAAAPFSHSPLSPMLDSAKLYQQLGSFQVAARGVARAMKAQLDDMRRRAAKRKLGTRQEQSDSDDSHGSDNGGYDVQEQRTPLLSEFWKKLHASMASQLSEFCKAATLLIVTVPGSVEEERSFSAMNFIKDERRNRLNANLSSTLRVYLDKTFTLKTFPYKEAIDYWMAGASARGRYLGHSG